VLALETSKTVQDLVIRNLKKKVRKLEKKLRARTPGMKLFKIGTSKRKSLDEEYVSKQERKGNKTKPMFDDSDFAKLDVDNAMENVEVNTTSIDVSAAGPSNVSTADPSTSTAGDIFEDEMMTITNTLVAIRSIRPRTTSVPEPTPKNPIKAQIQRDAKIAQRLFEEDQAQFEREAEQIRNKPPTRAQLRNKMVTYLKHMGKYTHNQIKSKSFEEIQKLYEREQKWINDFVPIDSEMVKDSRKGKAEGSRKKIVARKRTGEKLDDESVKRQKIEDDAEKELLRAYLDIILGDDEAVNIESLATKYPIVDWKTHALSEDKMYYEIIRGDGCTKFYKIFTKMLNDFDKQDVLDLYRLVKERFKTASLEGYDILLWGDLITVFEPSEDDDIWKARQDYTLIS
ncbi:hypothetical protein Tco_1295092, partial [Tanacetum coccineum]